jgi:hypothetical protein
VFCFLPLKETVKFIVAVRAHALKTQETKQRSPVNKQRYNKNTLSFSLSLSLSNLGKLGMWFLLLAVNFLILAFFLLVLFFVFGNFFSHDWLMWVNFVWAFWVPFHCEAFLWCPHLPLAKFG